MSAKKIKALIKANNSHSDRVQFVHLSKLVSSKNFDKSAWDIWVAVSDDPLEERLLWLERTLVHALEGQPDQRPIRNPTERKVRAGRARKQIESLVRSISALEHDENFSWSFALSLHAQDSCSQLARRFPVADWKRTVPPKPRLGSGWEEGVHASFLAMPVLLESLKSALDAWEQRQAWPIHASQGEGVERALFVRSVCATFRRLYQRPLHSFVADLANVFFPASRQLTFRDAARIEAKG